VPACPRTVNDPTTRQRGKTWTTVNRTRAGWRSLKRRIATRYAFDPCNDRNGRTVPSRVTGAEPAAELAGDAVNRAAEAAPGWAAPLPDDGDPEGIVPPAEDPELRTAPAVLLPPSGTAEVDALGGTVVPVGAEGVVTFGSVVVTLGTVVVTLGTVVVTLGTVVVTLGTVVVTFGMVVVTLGTVVVTFGMVVVIFGIVVETGSVVVTFGSVVDTGSVVEIVGSALVIGSCGTAERPRMGVVAKKPRRRRAARTAARLTRSAYPDPSAHNPDRPRLRAITNARMIPVGMSATAAHA
jgi:hypothetical protein